MSDKYQLNADGSVQNIIDGWQIPADLGNRHYQRYLADITAGVFVRPIKPSEVHVWDDVGKVWLVDADLQAAADRVAFVEKRSAQVAALKVTTAAGNIFDGDETSQERMARAILGMNETGRSEQLWVLADNTAIVATKAELVEALQLAGDAQTDLWVQP